MQITYDVEFARSTIISLSGLVFALNARTVQPGTEKSIMLRLIVTC